MKGLIFCAALGVVACVAVVGCGDSSGGSGGDGGNGSAAGGSGGASSSSSSSSSGMLGAGECRTSADCVEPHAGICLSPGTPLPCGACYDPPTPCTTDTECAMQDPTTICEPPKCSCGASECITGCMSDAECNAWEYCSPGHRCLPDVCSTNADCPDNFECASMACARKTCTADADCNGVCVNGQCHASAGNCTQLPP